MVGGWNEMVFKVHSNSNHSGILWLFLLLKDHQMNMPLLQITSWSPKEKSRSKETLSFPLNFLCSFSCAMIFMSGISHFLIPIKMIIGVVISRKYSDSERAKAFCLESPFTSHSSRVPWIETLLEQTSQINNYFINIACSPLSDITSWQFSSVTSPIKLQCKMLQTLSVAQTLQWIQWPLPGNASKENL